MSVRELRAQRYEIMQRAKAIVEDAEARGQMLTPTQTRQYDSLMREADDLVQEIRKAETGGNWIEAYSGRSFRLGLSDEERALAHYIRTGDRSGLSDLNLRATDGNFDAEVILPKRIETRAVVDSTMNITTAGDGGNLVPTGFVQQVAARRNEIRLSTKLGCVPVPGKGTTVYYPYESSGPELFGLTSEQSDGHTNNYERDALQPGKKAFTLAKYTKKIELTEELLEDEDAQLLDWISDSVGRSYGMTLNYLLLTEVAANGTSFKTFSSASVIGVDELESIAYNDDLAPYLDDGNSTSWVMKKSVHGEIVLLDDANTRRYSDNTLGPGLLGYPVNYSNYAGATQASAKSVYFGNWRYVGERLAPELRLLRDPYSVDGLVVLKFAFRVAYGVLQAYAVGFAVHPSA
jgi:HK97 family phage major capsid protein